MRAPPPQAHADLGVRVPNPEWNPEAFGGIVCRIDVYNNGPDAAQNVVVDVTIRRDDAGILSPHMPPNVWTATQSGFEAKLGTLSPNQPPQSLSFSVDFPPEERFKFTLTAHITSDTTDPNPNNNYGEAQKQIPE